MAQTPITNYQASLALTNFFQVNGTYPSQSGGGGAGFYLGQIGLFAGNFDPTGTGADGQLIPISQNFSLFTLIGTTYGGDGQSNFNLPNLDGATMIGAGQGPGLANLVVGQAVGTPSVTLTRPQTPPDIGGSSQPFNNYEPSLAITYMIHLVGVFPSRDGGGASDDLLGEVGAFAGAFAPSGWAVAAGQLLPINQNQALFSILGTMYGGNGQTTFALPDLRGRDIIGASSTDPIGTMTGQANVNLTNAQAPDHLGDAVQPFNNVQPSLAMNYIIALNGIFPSQDGTAADVSTPFLGQIMAFAGNFAPSGWALAQGQLLQINPNLALFSLLGTMYGGDGIKTFALPDLRDRTEIGVSGATPLGSITGSNLVTITASELPPLILKHDFNGDGHVDIALQNINDGSVAVWELNGAGLKSANSAAVLAVPGTAWKLVGSGDFYETNVSELLLQNTSSGQLAYWGVNASSTPPVLSTSPLLTTNPGSTWHAIATGDFNGDGHADIAFQKDDSSVAIWEMNGASLLTPTSAAVLGLPGTDWHLRATGDFYSDGVSDLALQNGSGSLAIWGVTQTGGGAPALDMTETFALPANLNPGPTWLLDGTGDFNADGHADFVFQDTTSSDVAIWEMNGASLLAPTSAAIVASPGTAWAVKSIGDYNGDGMSDILLQNNTDGGLAMWFMNGLTVLPASTTLSASLNPGTNWTPLA